MLVASATAWGQTAKEPESFTKPVGKEFDRGSSLNDIYIFENEQGPYDPNDRDKYNWLGWGCFSEADTINGACRKITNADLPINQAYYTGPILRFIEKESRQSQDLVLRNFRRNACTTRDISDVVGCQADNTSKYLTVYIPKEELAKLSGGI